MNCWNKIPWMAKIAILVIVLVSAVEIGLANRHTESITKAPHQSPELSCTVDARQLLALINQERALLNVPILTVDPILASSAQSKFNDELVGKYYGHDKLDGTSWSTIPRELGVNSTVSEDLNVNALSASSDWISLKGSPVHYASLTDPQFTRVGIVEQCTGFLLEKGTGPGDNSNLVNKWIGELTVVHLAAPEPLQVVQPFSGTLCNDGWVSPSTGRGTCSHHMGIAY